MRMLVATVLTVVFSLALFGCPDKNAGPDPAGSAKTATTAATGSAHPAGTGSAKGGW
jgi:hypothetical protein